MLESNYSMEFMGDMSAKADLIRSVALCGHLHSGKTLLCDMIIR